MDVNSLRIAKVFQNGGDVHYVLPYFQREYAWEEENWKTLIHDIRGIYNTYDPFREPEHFLGALVVIKDGMRGGTIPAFKLVDGQQRLVSVSLVLLTLANAIKDSNPSLHKKIVKLLVNVDETGLVRYKIVPTTKYDDQKTYFALIDGQIKLALTDSRIKAAFDYFTRAVNDMLAGGFDPTILFTVISNCMQVVFIDLDHQERPYEIFESLNNKGKQLSQPDLIRNFIAMKLPERQQELVFKGVWSEVENRLREKRTVSRIGEQSAFFRHYLAHGSGVLCNREHIYARFRDHALPMSDEEFL